MLAALSLVVFARAPVAGQVKTRLLLPVESAAALHLAFVRDVCRAGAQSGIGRRRLYIAGAEPTLLLATAEEAGFQVRDQGNGDLGQRMDRAIAAEIDDGASAVVLIGSDSPTMPAAYLQAAAGSLVAGADLVLGPATDGGYWLIGARRRCPELFAPGIAWGTDAVLTETLDRLVRRQAAGQSVRLLPFLYDVDTPADLRLLCAELRLCPNVAAATRAALAQLGLL